MWTSSPSTPDKSWPVEQMISCGSHRNTDSYPNPAETVSQVDRRILAVTSIRRRPNGRRSGHSPPRRRCLSLPFGVPGAGAVPDRWLMAGLASRLPWRVIWRPGHLRPGEVHRRRGHPATAGGQRPCGYPRRAGLPGWRPLEPDSCSADPDAGERAIAAAFGRVLDVALLRQMHCCRSILAIGVADVGVSVVCSARPGVLP